MANRLSRIITRTGDHGDTGLADGSRVLGVASEVEIIQLVRNESKQSHGVAEEPPPPIPQQAVFDARGEIAEVRIAEPMEDYIVSLVAATRRPAEVDGDLARYIQVGVSPRGSIAVDKCARAHSWLQGRDQVVHKADRVIIAFVQRKPANRNATPTYPFTQQCALAEPG